MNWRVNRFLYFTAQRLRNEPVRAAYNDLLTSKTLPSKELENIQGNRIKDLLNHAINHVPYYKEKFAAFAQDIRNVTPIESRELLKALPVLTKRTAILEYNNLQSSITFKTHNNVSSGTTGEPFQFPCDTVSWAYRHASIMRFLESNGVNFGDSYGYFSGQHWRSEYKLKTQAKDYLFNRKRLSAFSVSLSDVQHTYHWLLKNKASYIFGYPSTIADFVRISVDVLKLDVAKLNLKFVLATGETLEPSRQKYIETHFGCTVGNYYGSVEGGAGAFEGVEGYMHENMETTCLFTNPEGKIYQTDLFLRQMPLINFDMGDYAEPVDVLPKNLQVQHRVVGKIVGRNGEKITLPTGEKIHPMLLNYFFDLFTEEKHIRKFRFLFGRTCVKLLVEPLNESIPESYIKTMEIEMKRILPGCIVSIENVAQLPPLSNGKHKDWTYTD